MDIVSREIRSRMMAGIRGSDTYPELWVRRLLHRHGFRFRLHQKDLPGKPDIILPRHQTCIFVHGCFWHRHLDCKYAATPKTREDFWLAKFEKNVKRDLKNQEDLLQLGWSVLVLWECGIRRADADADADADMDWLLKAIPDRNQKYISWPNQTRSKRLTEKSL